MDGVTVSAKNIRRPVTSVKVDPTGITISTHDERDPQLWVMVFITPAALFGILNAQDSGSEFFYPPIPPLTPEEIDLTAPPPVPPLVSLPPVPRVGVVPPLPPGG